MRFKSLTVDGWMDGWMRRSHIQYKSPRIILLCIILFHVTGVSAESIEGHGSYLLLSRAPQPAQRRSQIPLVHLASPAEISLSTQQLQSHLPTAPRQGTPDALN